MMAAVAVAAVVCLVASNAYRHDGITDKRVVILRVGRCCRLRHRGNAQTPDVSATLARGLDPTPEVDHPIHDVINVSAGSCFLGWIIGAPAGWMSRRFTE